METNRKRNEGCSVQNQLFQKLTELNKKVYLLVSEKKYNGCRYFVVKQNTTTSQWFVFHQVNSSSVTELN